MLFGNPLIMEQNNADFLNNGFCFYSLWVKKWVGSENGVLGGTSAECEVADLKQWNRNGP